MFKVSPSKIELILKDFEIVSKISSITELQRYYYEKNNPASKEVRLIVKVTLADGTSLVIRVKNENDVTQGLLEKQSQFAELLKTNGIPSPEQYQTNGKFSKWYTINGYDVLVTVEEFVDGELKYVTPDIAEKTGKLLAQSHNISEKHDFHVKNPVLFNPFTENDLFRYDEFKSAGEKLPGYSQPLYQKITEKYEDYMQILSPLRNEPRYAVQGDISNCNLYQMENGDLGIFDFNRCGDNNLYCDAVMQAVFEARLMDYPQDLQANSKKCEDKILTAFLRGYQLERPFNDMQRRLYPYLYAIIDAFWASDIVWSDNSLLKKLEKKDNTAVHQWLEEIWKRLSDLSASGSKI